MGCVTGRQAPTCKLIFANHHVGRCIPIECMIYPTHSGGAQSRFEPAIAPASLNLQALHPIDTRIHIGYRFRCPLQKALAPPHRPACMHLAKRVRLVEDTPDNERHVQVGLRHLRIRGLLIHGVPTCFQAGQEHLAEEGVGIYRLIHLLHCSHQ